MKPVAVVQYLVAETRVWPRVSRQFFELTWAAICPPLVAILAVCFTSVWLENMTPESSHKSAAGLLFPLMLSGMTILVSLIYFDCRAREAFRSGAAQVRTTQGISAAITLIFLTVALTAEANRSQVSNGDALVLFLCLPVLFVCAGLLWHAASIIQSPLRRGLMLVGFVTLTAFVELQSSREVYQNNEERLFMLNSLLVAVAFAIQLSAWSARAFRHR